MGGIDHLGAGGDQVVCRSIGVDRGRSDVITLAVVNLQPKLDVGLVVDADIVVRRPVAISKKHLVIASRRRALGVIRRCVQRADGMIIMLDLSRAEGLTDCFSSFAMKLVPSVPTCFY